MSDQIGIVIFRDSRLSRRVWNLPTFMWQTWQFLSLQPFHVRVLGTLSLTWCYLKP